MKRRFILSWQTYRKKYPGTGHWIRVLFFFFLIIVITWYARQGYNNPFAFRPQVNLIRSKDYIYIRCFKKLKKRETDSFLLLLSNFTIKNQIKPSDTFPETVTFITPDVRNDIYNSFAAPPSNFIILDTSLANDTIHGLPDEWPRPSFTNDMAGIKDIALHYLYPFDDSLKAIYLEYNDIKVLLFNDTQMTVDTIKESFLKEKIDVVIINTTSEIPVLKLRELLRPRYLIVLPAVKTGEDIRSISNIIRPQSSDFCYKIVKDSKKRLFIKEQK